MQPGNSPYLNRVLTKTCAQCEEPAAEDSDRCALHRDQQRARGRKWARARRRANRRAKRCAFCGAPSSTYRCPTCLIKAGRTTSEGVDNGVDKSARLAARTRVEDGRTRYHGQPRRGSQPIGQLEAKELDDAIALLRTAKEGLAMARAAVQLSKVQRRAALHASVAHADRVARMIAELCERVGYDQQALVRDNDTE